jgi:hypothetical protein
MASAAANRDSSNANAGAAKRNSFRATTVTSSRPSATGG